MVGAFGMICSPTSSSRVQGFDENHCTEWSTFELTPYLPCSRADVFTSVSSSNTVPNLPIRGQCVRRLCPLGLYSTLVKYLVCLLYTSDAADERSSVDLGGRRIIKKKK